jgi:hypothetical protein
VPPHPGTASATAQTRSVSKAVTPMPRVLPCTEVALKSRTLGVCCLPKASSPRGVTGSVVLWEIVAPSSSQTYMDQSYMEERVDDALWEVAQNRGQPQPDRLGQDGRPACASRPGARSIRWPQRALVASLKHDAGKVLPLAKPEHCSAPSRAAARNSCSRLSVPTPA